MPTRILVVDDNRDTLRTYTKALSRKIEPKLQAQFSTTKTAVFPLEVEEADTVASAIKKLETQPFDILVVDLKIPGLTGEEMGGLDVITSSMKLDPLRPIIAITGYGSVALARKTLTQGVFDFIEKSDTAVNDLIQAVEKAIDSRNEKILRSGNPFTPMTGVEPAVFGGRTKELEFFEQRLNRALHNRYCEHFLILGDWGIGKSTLCKEFKKICQSRGYLAAVVPLECLQAGASVSVAASSIIEGIIRDLPYPVDRLKSLVKLFDSFGISILGTGLEFSRDTKKKELSPQAFLHDTLLSLWHDLKDKAEVFVILLDDLDNFATVSEIVMTLKQTLSMDSIRNTRILVGIASTPLNWQELTLVKRHHPLSRYFLSRVELAPLSDNELRETVLKSIAGTGVSFSSDVISRVFEYTEGHPFEMQVLCNHLFNNQISRRVELDAWEKALQASLHDLGIATFDQWYAHASGEEAKLLRVIARSEIPLTVKQIQNAIHESSIKVSSKNIPKYLQRLAEKRLISKSSRGLYAVADRMFRAYLYAVE